jgi:hypothetical protein
MQHEYHWVLRESVFESGFVRRFLIDRHSPEGRRTIARFHSDAAVTLRSGTPHWFRRTFKRRQRASNSREFLRWLADPCYDPVMNVRHRGSAQWAWW